MRSTTKNCIGLVLGALLIASPAIADPVDLSSWIVDGNGSWTVAGDNNSVTQGLNSPPTVFHNGVGAQGTEIAGTIEVQTSSDNDFVGFVLGYTQGDIDGNPDTDYLLVDWKQGTQSGWDEGMSISRVTGPIQAGGTDTSADVWTHTGNVEFIQRANTLGNIGWEDNVEYAFEITFRPNLVQVVFDGNMEFELAGSFANGAFGFYNFSQENVRYAGITANAAIPVPPALMLMLSGIAALGWSGRRRMSA